MLGSLQCQIKPTGHLFTGEVGGATAENQSKAIGKKFSSSKSMSISIKSSTPSTVSSEFIKFKLPPW